MPKKDREGGHPYVPYQKGKNVDELFCDIEMVRLGLKATGVPIATNNVKGTND